MDGPFCVLYPASEDNDDDDVVCNNCFMLIVDDCSVTVMLWSVASSPFSIKVVSLSPGIVSDFLAATLFYNESSSSECCNSS